MGAELSRLKAAASDTLGRLSEKNAIRRFRSTREDFYVDLAEAIKDKEPVAKFLSIRRTRAIEQKDAFARLYQIF
ncbi:hypothetical protein [Burkholderia ubonensis]|nr:hypothetical protein [Burkholderia ubonensis]